MESTIIYLMNEYGYLGIMLLIMIENVFPPIPSEIILGFGGFMTKKTELTMIGVILYASIGSCLGSALLYYLGFYFSQNRLNSFFDHKFIRIFLIKLTDIKKINNWFMKKGAFAILFGRFVPVVRSLISIPAGISKMNFYKFLFFTFIGTFIWNAILTIMGYILGNNWYKIVNFVSNCSFFVTIILIILSIIFIFTYFNKRKISS